MAAIDQINVNIGTEQSPNYVLHDVNDKRISSTAVTTATHLLATDASLSAINPITAANLASVLGAEILSSETRVSDLSNIINNPGIYEFDGIISNSPFGQTNGTTGIVFGKGPYQTIMIPVIDYNDDMYLYLNSLGGGSSPTLRDWYKIKLEKVSTT